MLPAASRLCKRLHEVLPPPSLLLKDCRAVTGRGHPLRFVRALNPSTVTCNSPLSSLQLLELHSEGPARIVYGMARPYTLHSRCNSKTQATTKYSDRLGCWFECFPGGWGSVSWLALAIIERMPVLRYQAPPTNSQISPHLAIPQLVGTVPVVVCTPSLLQRLAQLGSR